MSAVTMSAPLDVLLDPALAPEVAEVLAGVAQISAARPVRCAPGTVLGAVHPGSVAVLVDPSPAVVEILVAWGGTVMAVRQGNEGASTWLSGVVDAGACAALLNPDIDTLALTLATVLQERSSYAAERPRWERAPGLSLVL